MTNIVDPDHTAPSGSLIWVYTVDRQIETIRSFGFCIFTLFFIWIQKQPLGPQALSNQKILILYTCYTVWTTLWFYIWAASWQNHQNGMCAQQRLGSDWADAQADLSFRWAHMPFCWFCHEAAHFMYSSYLSYIAEIVRMKSLLISAVIGWQETERMALRRECLEVLRDIPNRSHPDVVYICSTKFYRFWLVRNTI